MSDQRNRDMGDMDGLGDIGKDAVDRTHIGFVDTDQDSGQGERLQVHDRHHVHDPGHVNLQQDEYTPEEVARLMGTSLEVVMHAIRAGELKAEREGQAVVCITHTNVVDWLRQRGSGV